MTGVGNMKLSDFKYELPESLIAQYPLENRSASRMMVLNRSDQAIKHDHFTNIVDYFNPGDALIINETKVFPARLIGFKEKTNAQVEVLLLRQLEETMWEVLVKPARKVRIGNRLIIADTIGCDVIDNTISGGRVVKFDDNGQNFFDFVEQVGDSPLPPYIKRATEPIDKERYQTVYAKRTGAVAAPTAGLHFTSDILEQIKQKGVEIIPLVLHVGLGTFRPVQVEDLSRHQMDSEFYELTTESAARINQVKKNGGRLFAVGTTSVRVLETVAIPDRTVKSSSGWTDKFIYPPYQFKMVDGLLTNFHQSQSTLYILICTFAGYEFARNAYVTAIDEKYRFFSYGDAMLIV
jgi:S-adenosylmethionine:tRNA ribosyltransferase-isomerase